MGDGNMKTLIFMGSPRKKGSSQASLEIIKEHLQGEVNIVDAYSWLGKIKPCVDCRYCWKHPSCAIKNDNMYKIYDMVEEANNIILISPLYFATVPGPLKIIIDRLQVYWACHVRGDGRSENIKNGFNVVIGGAPEYENQFKATDLVATNIFNDLFVNNLGNIHFSDSDHNDVRSSAEFIKGISRLTKQLNENVIENAYGRIVK